MQSVDVFYYVAATGIAFAVAIFAYLAYQTSITLKSLRKILNDVGDTTGDINAMKNAVKYGISNFGSIFSEKIRKGGVFNGKKQRNSR
jgi:hypothetical protein